MSGSDVTLAQALTTSGRQKSNSPELTLKSPREGPLKWDADQRKWLNQPAAFNPDLKLSIDYNSMNRTRVIDTLQAPAVIKDQLQFIKSHQEEIMMHRRTHTKH